MTDEIQLKRELLAIDGLLEQLMPEDATNLALDIRRRAAATAMVGSIVMARQLLAQARGRLNGAPKRQIVVTPERRGRKPGPKTKRKTATEDFILRHLSEVPQRKSEVVKKATGAGFLYGIAYTAINHLIDEGKVKQEGLLMKQTIRRV